MGTLNWHMLEHVGTDIKRMGEIQFIDVYLYEYSHLLLKNMFRTTSRRSKTAMMETIKRMALSRQLHALCTLLTDLRGIQSSLKPSVHADTSKLV